MRIAVRNLIKHRSRSLILGGAIGSVTALMIIMLATTAGIEDNILKGATTLLSGHVNISGFYKISQSSMAPVVYDYPKLESLARNEITEARLMINRVKAYGKIISETQSIMIPMWGVTMADEKELLGALPLAKKRDYIADYQPGPGAAEVEGNISDLGQRGTIVLFASQARKLKVGVGDTLTVYLPTYRNMANTLDVRVVAVLKDLGLMSAFGVYLNSSDLRQSYQIPETSTGQIMLYLKDIGDAAKVENKIRTLLENKGYVLMEKDPQPFFMKFDKVLGESWLGEKIDITTWQDESSFIKWVVDTFHMVTFVSIVILMIIVVLGLVNTLWISIRERTNEIGTMRAIGLQRRSVLGLFFMEALILSMVATLVGLLLGVMAAFFLDSLEIPIRSEALLMFFMSDTLTLKVSPGDCFLTFAVIITFVVIGAVFPAYTASKMKPITAINYIQ
jgi:ABC-type lipoprotein release transport system permease subunit